MSRPTDDAIYLFQTGQEAANRAMQNSTGKGAAAVNSTENQTAYAIYCIAQGLSLLSTGLRATYIKLEEIEALIKKQGKS